ncbi:uncharacterized protein [Pyxicephalus adspersus]|uniref:uncharacterized protein isoform X2 n=1 Tax=Pyxicephalus adspersus TaxID=30357 RepID=UPI003B5938B1
MDEKGTQLPPTSSTSPVEEHERQVDSDDSDHAQAVDDKQLLADVLENTADMVEIAVMSVKSTQVAYCCVVEALSQLSDMLDISCKVFESSQQLAARFMSQKGHDGYQELFLGHPELDVTYSALQRSLEEAEEAFPHLMSRMKRSHAQDSLVCALSSHSEDEDEADNDKTSHHKQEDEADNDKTSHHKQVEKVCVEEHMGGAYLTQRRGSLRRSASADELSSQLSEERSDIQPNAQSPKCKSPTSKIVHHQQSKSSDSDVEEPPSPEP